MFKLSVVFFKNKERKTIKKEQENIKNNLSLYFLVLTDGKKVTVTYSNWMTARIVYYVNDNKGIRLLVKKNKYRDMSEVFEIDSVYNNKIKIFFYPRRTQFLKGIKTIIISNWLRRSYVCFKKNS